MTRLPVREPLMTRGAGGLVYIYADEACLGNQYKDRDNPGGAGVLVEAWKDGRWHRRDLWLSERASTNNRMAIQSATVPLTLLRPARIIFTSDSQYLVKGCSEWISGWVRRDWKKGGGKPVANAELWQELLAAAEPHEIEWRWVRGHAGHPQNEWANELATTAAARRGESGGFVESGFEDWLEHERVAGRLTGYDPAAPPVRDETFRPAPLPSLG